MSTSSARSQSRGMRGRLSANMPIADSHQVSTALWVFVDELIVYKQIATITQLENKIAAQRIAPTEQRE